MMWPLLVGIALFGGYLMGSRVGGHRWRRELMRIDGLLATQSMPYLARRAADLGIRPVPPESGAGAVAFQVVALCAMIEAKERGGPEPDTLRLSSPKTESA